jgi:hypothetical protein
VYKAIYSSALQHRESTHRSCVVCTLPGHYTAAVPLAHHSVIGAGALLRRLVELFVHYAPLAPSNADPTVANTARTRRASMMRGNMTALEHCLVVGIRSPGLDGGDPGLTRSNAVQNKLDSPFVRAAIAITHDFLQSRAVLIAESESQVNPADLATRLAAFHTRIQAHAWTEGYLDEVSPYSCLLSAEGGSGEGP